MLDSIAKLFQSETFGTIIAGVFVYVICEYLKEIWLQPLQEYKQLKAQISKNLIFYANIYTNPILTDNQNKSDHEKASYEFRSHAADLVAFAEMQNKIHFGIPKSSILREASKELIGVSNRFFAPDRDSAHRFMEDNERSREEIQHLLKLKIK